MLWQADEIAKVEVRPCVRFGADDGTASVDAVLIRATLHFDLMTGGGIDHVLDVEGGVRAAPAELARGYWTAQRLLPYADVSWVPAKR
jgi:hypothetical protein